MNDDWRLRVDVREARRAPALLEHLDATELEHELETSFANRVIVSVDDSELFCYAGTREQAEAAAHTVAEIAAEHGWTATVELRHWHPTAERWEDPDLPLPSDDASRAAEHAERIAAERSESHAQGYPEFEVRVQCTSRSAAAELAERLRDEGITVVHRWHAVLAGAPDEDSAEQLATRLRSEAPPGAQVTVEGNLRAIYEDGPWRPFSIFGGLGG